MFTQDSKTVQLPRTGAMGGTAGKLLCNTGELLTGVGVRTSNGDPDEVQSIYNFQCTNPITGVVRNSVNNAYFGNTSGGTQYTLNCPTGQYISAMKSASTPYGNTSVLSGLAVACQALSSNPPATNVYAAGNGKPPLVASYCPSGYYVNGMNFSSGSLVNSASMNCINMNPRINVLENTATTQACCMGTQGSTAAATYACTGYSAQNGNCDAYFEDYCTTNSGDQICSCFNVPQGIPACYSTSCINGGYMTSNMKTSCPNEYINCQAQLTAANSGTQLVSTYGLEQNCGAGSGTAGTNATTAGTLTTVTPTATTTTTTSNAGGSVPALSAATGVLPSIFNTTSLATIFLYIIIIGIIVYLALIVSGIMK